MEEEEKHQSEDEESVVEEQLPEEELPEEELPEELLEEEELEQMQNVEDTEKIEELFRENEGNEELDGYDEPLEVPSFQEKEVILTDKDLILKEYFIKDPEPKHVIELYKDANYIWKNKMEEFYQIHGEDPYSLKESFFNERFPTERQLTYLYTARNRYYSLNHYIMSRSTKQSGLAKRTEVSDMVDTIKQIARLTKIYGLFVTYGYKGVSKVDAYLLSVKKNMTRLQTQKYDQTENMNPYEKALCRRILALEIANLSQKNNPIEIYIKRFENQKTLLSDLPKDGHDIFKGKLVTKLLEEMNKVINENTRETRKGSLLECLTSHVKSIKSEYLEEPEDLSFYNHYVTRHKDATVADFENRFGWIFSLRDRCVVTTNTPNRDSYADASYEQRQVVNKALAVIGMNKKPSYYFNNFSKLYNVCEVYLKFLGIIPSLEFPDPSKFLNKDGYIDITDNPEQIKMELFKIKSFKSAKKSEELFLEQLKQFPNEDKSVKKIFERCKENSLYADSLNYYYSKLQSALQYYDVNEDPDPMITDVITETLPEILQLMGNTNISEQTIIKKINHYRSQNRLHELYQVCMDYKHNKSIPKHLRLYDDENVKTICKKLNKTVDEIKKEDLEHFNTLSEEQKISLLKNIEVTLAYKNILKLERRPIKFLRPVEILRKGKTRTIYIPDIDLTKSEIENSINDMETRSNELKRKISEIERELSKQYMSDESVIQEKRQEIEDLQYKLAYIDMNIDTNAKEKGASSFNRKFWERCIKKQHKISIDFTKKDKKDNENIMYITVQGISKGYNGHYEYMLERPIKCIYTINNFKTENFIEFLEKYREVLIKQEEIDTRDREIRKKEVVRYKTLLLEKLQELKSKIAQFVIEKPGKKREYTCVKDKQSELHKLMQYTQTLQKKKEKIESSRKKHIMVIIGEELINKKIIKQTELTKMLNNPLFINKNYEKLVNIYRSVEQRKYKYPTLEITVDDENELSELQKEEQDIYCKISSIRNTLDVLMSTPLERTQKQILYEDIFSFIRRELPSYEIRLRSNLSLENVEQVYAEIVNELSETGDKEHERFLQKMEALNEYIAIMNELN